MDHPRPRTDCRCPERSSLVLSWLKLGKVMLRSRNEVAREAGRPLMVFDEDEPDGVGYRESDIAPFVSHGESLRDRKSVV